MIKYCLVIVQVFLMYTCSVFGQQNLISLGNVSYVGYYDSNLVVLQESTWDLYSVVESSDIQIPPNVKLLRKGNKQYDINNSRKAIDYIKDDFTIEQKVIKSKTKPYSYKYELLIHSNSIDVKIPIKHLINKFEVSTKNKLIVYEGGVDYNCEGCHKDFFLSPDLMVIDYGKPNPKPEKIGIKGSHPVIRGNNLYFFDFFQKYCYDESQYNVYRAPLGKWKETELIFRQTYTVGYIFPNEKYMFAKVYEKAINNGRTILYNLETKSYVYFDELYLYEPQYVLKRYENTSGASFYSYVYETPVLIKGQFYYVKNLPSDFPYKYRELKGMDDDDRSVIMYKGDSAFFDLPKRVDLTLPVDEKERLYNFPR